MLESSNPKFMAQLQDDNQKITYKRKTNLPGESIVVGQKERSVLVERDLDEFVSKVKAGEIELSSESQFLSKLVNISFDQKNPDHIAIRKIVDEIANINIDNFIFIQNIKNNFYKDFNEEVKNYLESYLQ